MLNTLATKQDLANAAIDADSDVEDLSMTSNIEELKKRLEILTGQKPESSKNIKSRQKAQSGILKTGHRVFKSILLFIKKIFH
jgi:predicted RecB family endonuclease